MQVPFVSRHRRRVVAEPPESVRHVDDGDVVVRLQLERLAEVADGLPVPPLFEIEVAERKPRVNDLRVGLDDLIQHGDGPVESAFLTAEIPRCAHQVEQIDLVLRVRAVALGVVRARDERAHVAQCRQPLPHLGVHIVCRRRRRRLLEGRLDFAQPGHHAVADGPPLAVDVCRLLRVALEVEELGARGVDELIAARAQRTQVAPPEMVQRVHGLGVAFEAQFDRRAGHQRDQAFAGQAGRYRNSGEIEKRRRQVDDSDGILDHAGAGLRERRVHDERHVRDALVDEEPVRFLPVVAETLAVIAQHRHDRLLEQAALLEKTDDAAHLRVGEGDFAPVGMAFVLGLEGLGRIVRRVRVVQVNPREEPPVLHRVDPRQGLVDHLVAGTLDVAQRAPAALRDVEVVEVLVESLVDAPLAVEDECGDEPAGREPLLLQHLGQRLLFGRQEEPAVVAHAMFGREPAGEHARVRRQRERRARHRLREARALTGEPIEGRCLDEC